MCVSVAYVFFNDTATTEIYTLSLHDALPILDAEVPVLYAPRLAGKARSLSGYLAQGYRTLGRILSVERSEEHTSELQSRQYLVCRLLLEKKNTKYLSLRSVDPMLALRYYAQL